MKCKDCNNFGCSYRNSFEKCFYQDDYLDEDFNWKSFRAEAAKDILCAMIPRYEGSIGNEVVEYAIFITDKLISNLKKKEKK